MSKKRLFKLGLVAVALLLIPRRSSKKSDIVPNNTKNEPPSKATVSDRATSEPATENKARQDKLAKDVDTGIDS